MNSILLYNSSSFVFNKIIPITLSEPPEVICERVFLVTLQIISNFIFNKIVPLLLYLYSNLIFNRIDSIILEEDSDFSFDKAFPTAIQLFSGTQNNHSGTVPIERVEAIRRRLLSQSEPRISFREGKVSKIITGGNCSAMSLEFANAYIKCREDLLKKFIKVNTSSEERAELFLGAINKLGKDFQTSNEEMRIRQAAYNTIEVLPTEGAINNASKGKIQSIANYHNFKIDFTTDEINAETLSNPEDVREYVSLPEGIYLLRIIKPAQNEKLEHYGHSTIYIKENDCQVFYDPNCGAYNLTGEDIASKFFTIFQRQWLMYEINKIRFHRLSA